MVTAVEVAEDISSLLARYEIDEAAELVEGAAGTTLPPALCEALRQLLRNSRLGVFPKETSFFASKKPNGAKTCFSTFCKKNNLQVFN
jgi:hypothetical protein